MEKSSSNSLGNLLRNARAGIAMTQRDVEAAIAISNAYLSQLESGKVKEPSPSVLHKLAELYRIDYASLLQLAGYPLPSTGARKTKQYRASNAIGPLNVDEESALLEYLQFLRSKGRSQ